MPDTPPPATAESPAPDPLTGTLLGAYRVLEKIGQGGMGAVYVVEHVELKKKFAAKVLAGFWAEQPGAVERLELEARAASQLDHENIVEVVHFGRSFAGTVFLVMELLRGETLQRAIARGRFGFDDALRVAVPICRALGAAHSAKIVHRDLKPENVFISRRPGGRSVVKLLDFGIARLTETERDGGRVTRTGQVMGSPRYMSPEAARGAPDVDARADLYAVGVILYELVTGRVPFAADNYLHVLYLQNHERPRPPRALRPDLPPALERVILRALEKDRAARYQSAEELARALLAAFRTDVDIPLGALASEPAGGDFSTPSGWSVGDAQPHPISSLPPTHHRDATQVDNTMPSNATRREPAARPPANLGGQPTQFIGRPREVVELSALVRSARLITLTGAGGAGKTRLATEIAARAAPEFRGGTWFVDLAALTDGTLVADTVAHALGLELRSREGALASLAAAIGDARMLVLLDNCEHLVAACATLAEALLRSCPGVHLVATSREPLGVAGETTYRVPPLSMPDPERVRGPSDLLAYDAVALFLERARAAAPGFELTARNARVVAEICVRLDGMPLALELAAARVRNLSVEDIHARLDDRFRLLTGGARTALPRQKTLRALVDWSHDLLDERQRILWRRLAVFAGGFTLAEAEVVVAGDGLPESEVFDVVCELCDRSILVADTRAATTRYRLLDTLRQYARERLAAAGETGVVRARHRDAYLHWVEAMATRYAGTQDDAEWFERLSAEHDNLREAMRASLDGERTVAPSDPVTHRFAVALRRFWLVRGHYTEALSFVRPMLERYQTPSAARLDLLEAANTFATLQLDFATALGHVLEGLALARELGERVRESILRTHRAYLHFLQCRFAEADELAAEALALAREVEGAFPLIFALNISGMIAARVGQHPRAHALLGECRAITETTGGRQYHANVLESLGNAYSICDGHYARALPLFRECAALFSQVGDSQGELLVCERMAEVAASRGQEQLAARLIAAADLVRAHLGSPREPVYVADLAPAMAAIESKLTPDERARARAEGRALAFADVVALALSVG